MTIYEALQELEAILGEFDYDQREKVEALLETFDAEAYDEGFDSGYACYEDEDLGPLDARGGLTLYEDGD